MLFAFDFMFNIIFIFSFVIFIFVFVLVFAKILRKMPGDAAAKNFVKSMIGEKEDENSKEVLEELRCPYCGAPIHKSDSECEYCGSRL